MAAKPKNPDWQEDIQFFLDKGLSFSAACRHANVSYMTAKRHVYAVF